MECYREVSRGAGFCALHWQSLLFKCLSWLPHPIPPCHPPHSLPSPAPKAQPVRGSGYCGHAHFSIMSSSACRKRKPLVQPETLEHSTRDSSLSSALHFLNEIPLPLSNRERWREGGREECSSSRKKILFFLFFSKCQRVERRSFGGGEGVWSESRYSEEVCLPFGHFVLDLALHTGAGFVLKGTYF